MDKILEYGIRDRNPIISQIEATLKLKDRLLCIAGINHPNLFSSYVPAAQEESPLYALADGLLKLGLSPSETASYIRDATGRIYLFVLQGPIGLRGVSWFGKGGLHHQLMDIQNYHMSQLQTGNQDRGVV